MQIREGNYYISRRGEMVGPMEVSTQGKIDIVSPWYVEGMGLYRENGEFGYGENIYYPPFDITETVDNAARKHVEGNT